MELAPFRSIGSIQVSHASIKKPNWAYCSSYAWKRNLFPQALISQAYKGSLPRRLKVSETTADLTSNSVSSSKSSQGPVEKKASKSIFPDGFEALILTICDETKISELKMKVNNFEVHLKRDIGISEASVPTVSKTVLPTTAPPIPSEPMSESTTAGQQDVPQEASPFSYINSAKALKLASLEASSSDAYILVSSSLVGTFRSGRTVKGQRLPPSCKEGDLIKEGKTIGFVDQLGKETPVKSDVAGEVLKFLCKDGEAVGYGDPIIAVLPSFHEI